MKTPGFVDFCEIREKKFLPEKRNFSKGRRQINTATPITARPADPKKNSCSTIGVGVFVDRCFLAMLVFIWSLPLVFTCRP